MSNIVSHNSITGANLAGVQVYQVNYIQPDFYNLNNVVVGNRISDMQTGVLVQRSRHTLVDSNSISFVSAGIREEKGSDYSLIVGNLIHDHKARDIVLTEPRSSKQ